MSTRTPKSSTNGSRSNHVKIVDIGPIIELEFDVPEDGGLVVLRGANSDGKTTALRTLETISTGRNSKDIEHRRGAVMGEAEALGARITVTRSPRRSGKLEVAALDGKFSILDIVEPELDDPFARDRKRIKSLLTLLDVKADKSLFYKSFAGLGDETQPEVLRGQEAFERLVSTKAMASEDVVILASRIKSDLEEYARKFEDEQKKEIARAEAAREAASGVDIKLPDDEDKLTEDYEDAVNEASRLRSEFRTAQSSATALREARESLNAAEATQGAGKLADAEDDLKNAMLVRDKAQRKVSDLQRQLALAEGELSNAGLRVTAAEDAVGAVKEHEVTLAEWRRTIETGTVKTKVTEEDVAQADEDKKAASEAIKTGTLVRAAKLRLAEAEKHMLKAAALAEKAEQYREVGKGTDDVLSELISGLGCPLTVRHGRLMANIGKGEEPFDKLGAADQWTMVIKDIAAPALNKGGRKGMLVVKQEGFEGMDTNHRNVINRAAKEVNLLIITAEKSDVPGLRAEVYEEKAVPAKV